MNTNRKRIFSAFACLSIAVFLVIGIIYCFAEESELFADYINGTLSHSFRQIMASVSNTISFSLFELIIIFSPVIVFLLVYSAMNTFSKGNGLRFIINLLSFLLLFYSGHLLALGIGYQTTDIDEKMGLSEVEATEENLSRVLSSLIEEINALADNVPRDDNGLFEPGYSNDEISKKLCTSYSKFANDYQIINNFDSRFKSVGAYHFLSYLGLTGMYTYYTGEANVNSDYPAYEIIFTAAHEMAHQRGVLRENEANFVAYLVTSTSEDPNIRYSGALNMYSYFASALYKTNEELYYSIAKTLKVSAKADILASNAVYQKYGDTIFIQISDFANNLYLKSNGTEGIISYSRVVMLVLSYYE